MKAGFQIIIGSEAAGSVIPVLAIRHDTQGKIVDESTHAVTLGYRSRQDRQSAIRLITQKYPGLPIHLVV